MQGQNQHVRVVVHLRQNSGTFNLSAYTRQTFMRSRTEPSPTPFWAETPTEIEMLKKRYNWAKIAPHWNVTLNGLRFGVRALGLPFIARSPEKWRSSFDRSWQWRWTRVNLWMLLSSPFRGKFNLKLTPSPQGVSIGSTVLFGTPFIPTVFPHIGAVSSAG